MLTIDHVSRKFHKRTVLRQVSFKLEKGVMGVLGPNGSGKTTLFRIIAGIMKPTQGCVSQMPGQKLPIGYLPQTFGLIGDYTLKQHLEFFACLKKIPKPHWEEVILHALSDVNLVQQQNIKCRKLSGGMVRRAGIAQAIMDNPDLILLDEPTVGLDPEERMRFAELILRLGSHSKILLATHIIEDIAEVSSEILILSQGEALFQGDKNQLADKASDKVYGMPQTEAQHWQEYGLITKKYESETGEAQSRYVLINGNGPKPDSVYRIRPQIEEGYIYLVKRHKGWRPYE